MRKPETQFKKNGDEARYTLSTLLKKPHPALFNRSYGESFYEAIARMGKIEGARVFLEVGGGHGYFAKNFLTCFKKNNESLYESSFYTLCDVSARYLSRQKDVLRNFKKKTAFVRCDALKLPFKEESFKGIVFIHETLSALEEVFPKTLLQFVKEAERIMQKGSVLIIMDKRNRMDFQSLCAYGNEHGFKSRVFPLYRFVRVNPRVRVVGFKNETILTALKYNGNFLCMTENELKQKLKTPLPSLCLMKARQFFGYRNEEGYSIFAGVKK